MSFMKPEIYFGEFYEVTANHGETWIVPVDVSGRCETNADLSDYVEGTIDNPEGIPDRHAGWLGRLSAPGYMDCTDWSVYPSREDAEADLRDDDDENTDES